MDDDPNRFRGKTVAVEPEQIMETRGWKTCDECGALYDEAYCSRCEEMSG